MTFPTITFFLFLTLVFVLYWTVRARKAQNWILLLASYVFYAYWDWRFAFLLLGTSVIDFSIGIALDRSESPRIRRVLLLTSCATNLGVLGFFKYFNFFMDTFFTMTMALGWDTRPLTMEVILPLGISFYTFQEMTYSIDVYRRKLKAIPSLPDFLLFVSFFPQLVAGPIERGTHLLPQIGRERTFHYPSAVDGCRRILWGLFKKMALADTLATLVVDPVYSDPQSFGGRLLLLATLCFALQIYYDFSAYSDIAIGTAQLFGFSLMRNFAYPYFSQNVMEFWKRWHISLSTWFRDYLFIPLGGSHAGPRRLALNVLLTFAVSGFWHGASWTFVVWGLLHGCAYLVSRSAGLGSPKTDGEPPGGRGLFPGLAVVGRIAATFAFVCLTWVFFRASSLETALFILGRIATDTLHPSASAFLPQYFPPIRAVLLVGAAILAEWAQRGHDHPLFLDRWPRAARWAAYAGLFWLTLLSMPAKSSPFIYFQF